MFDTDVFVLGGGPAGLAAAIASRQAGLRVILADAERPPIDKACGEGLMPDSLAAASQLGIRLSPDYGIPFRGIRFWAADRTVAADFPNGAGLGVRRTVLQLLLIQHAQNVGVKILWGCPVTGLEGNTVSMGRNRIQARWIVGADGSQSSVRRWTGLQNFRRDSQRFSYRRHYRIAPWSEYMEIYWGERCQFYLTPVTSEEVCLVLMTQDPYQRIANALPQFPLLEKRLSGAEPTTGERGALAATRKLRRVTRGNVALIGDASGTVDPITGEGLCLSFKQAVALAKAFETEDLGFYERAYSQIARRPRFMADFMLLMDRSALLRRRVLTAFETRPKLFAHLLAMHVGEVHPLHFAVAASALGWEVVRA